jgi:hypothetical protein
MNQGRRVGRLAGLAVDNIEREIKFGGSFYFEIPDELLI